MIKKWSPTYSLFRAHLVISINMYLSMKMNFQQNESNYIYNLKLFSNLSLITIYVTSLIIIQRITNSI